MDAACRCRGAGRYCRTWRNAAKARFSFPIYSGMKNESEVATSLLAKLRTFLNEELDGEEAEMFSWLLAPGVSLAYTDAEVVGFAVPEGRGQWRPGPLAGPLCEALRDGGVRVVGSSV